MYITRLGGSGLIKMQRILLKVPKEEVPKVPCGTKSHGICSVGDRLCLSIEPVKYTGRPAAPNYSYIVHHCQEARTNRSLYTLPTLTS